MRTPIIVRAFLYISPHFLANCLFYLFLQFLAKIPYADQQHYNLQLKNHHLKSKDKKEEYEAEFKKVSVAYDVLSNPKKRQEYDMQLQCGGDGMNGQSIHDLFKNMNMQGSNIFNFFNII